jgi:hypothetical protein
MTHKFAGVTVDYYDDRGETLKAKFPTVESLPEMIKSASVQPKEKLANEDFALVMVDRGHVFRKFACVDPGTTAMSVIYFMEHGDKLPKSAQKLAAANLVEACIQHNMMPPATLTKTAAVTTAPVVNVTGESPAPKVKMARPSKDEDYAVVLEDGRRLYPIDNWDRVKTAEAYWLDKQQEMEAPVRRQYAVKLAQKSFIMGYPLHNEIVQLGALSYHNHGHLKHAIEMRKVACDPSGNGREFLDELFEKRASIHPEVYAECLRRFDIDQGLDAGWDRIVLDPWASTFGVKTASEIVWEQGAERVTAEELHNLANNNSKALKKDFTTDFVDQFQKDPVVLFNSMPDPQKKMIARLANDSAAMGGSEYQPTKAPEQGMSGTKLSA